MPFVASCHRNRAEGNGSLPLGLRQLPEPLLLFGTAWDRPELALWDGLSLSPQPLEVRPGAPVAYHAGAFHMGQGVCAGGIKAAEFQKEKGNQSVLTPSP